MSFRNNLQHLRATRNLTQEQLAMLLGVSRQSVTKWESERAYPEMDKLLKMCSIFDCTLDELVQGDLTDRPVTPEAAAVSAAIPEDTCGYDAHMRSRAWHIALGVGCIIAGVALASFLGSMEFGGIEGGLFSVIALFLGVFVGLALIIPSAMAHGAFVRAHPFVADFYTPEDRTSATRLLATGIVGGIGCIFLGIVFCVILEIKANDQAATGAMLFLIALSVSCIIYAGLMHERVNLDNYNTQEVAEELTVEQISALPNAERREQLLVEKRRSEMGGAVCGIIMLVATVAGLVMLFDTPLHTPYFWLAWVFGGIACGIASIAIAGFSRR